MKRKLTAIFLATVLSLGGTLLLASCGRQEQSTSVATTTGKDIRGPMKPQIPINFKGDEYTDEDRIVKVAYLEGRAGEYTRRSLKADELSEAVVDMATKTRDARLKEQFGLMLELIPYDTHSYGSNSETLESLMIAICADTCDFDIIVSRPGFATALTKTGHLLNLAEAKDWMPEQFDLLDLNASYWSKAYNDAMSYKGNYFWITGGLALRYSGSMYATFVNERIYQDNLRSTYGDIFTRVKEGYWTIDLMTEMITKLQTTAPDANGLVYESNEMLTAMAIGMETDFSYNDPETGAVSLTVMGQRTLDSGEKLRALIGTVSAKQFAYDYTDASMKEFAKGNSLFAVNTLIAADLYLKDMTDPFMALPLPKYDVWDEYRTPLSESVDIFAIPLASSRIPQAVVVLEFMCAYNHENVIPLFFENMSKGKYTHPDAASAMDLIHKNAYGDFAAIWSVNVGNIERVFHEPADVNKGKLQRQYNTWTSELHNFTGKLESAIETYQAQKEKILGA